MSDRPPASSGNAIGPELVIIGGSLSQAGPVLADRVRDALHQTSLPINANVDVALGQLGKDTTALGGVALILTHVPTARLTATT